MLNQQPQTFTVRAELRVLTRPPGLCRRNRKVRKSTATHRPPCQPCAVSQQRHHRQSNRRHSNRRHSNRRQSNRRASVLRLSPDCSRQTRCHRLAAAVHRALLPVKTGRRSLSVKSATPVSAATGPFRAAVASRTCRVPRAPPTATTARRLRRVSSSARRAATNSTMTRAR